MTDWPVKTLGEVCDFVRGVTYDKADARSEIKSGFIPLLRATNITEKGLLREDFVFVPKNVVRTDQKLTSGDALITIASGSASVVGRSVLVEDPGEMTFGAFCGVLRPGPEILPRYLSHFMSSRSVRAAWSEAAQGTNINNLKRDDILQTECLLPPLEEQKRIVALLDAATARVTELTACYEQARTHANDLFTSALRDALESNHDWPVKTLGDISEIAYGYTESAKSEEVGPKFLRITDIKERGVNWDEVPFCPIDTEQLKRHRLEDGDIVFARTGATTGKSFLVIDPPLAVCASYLIRLRIDKKMVSPDFLNLNFQTTGYWKQVNDGMSGAAQGGFNATKLGLLEIPVPSLAEQKKIVVQLDSMQAKTSEMVAAYDAKLTAAKNLRQSILEAAFAGDL